MKKILIAFAIVTVLFPSISFAYLDCKKISPKYPVEFVDLTEIYPDLKPDVQGKYYSFVKYFNMIKAIEEKYPKASDEKILASLLISKYRNFGVFCDDPAGISHISILRKTFYTSFITNPKTGKIVLFNWHPILTEAYLRDSKGRLKAFDTSHLAVAMHASAKGKGNINGKLMGWLLTTFADETQFIRNAIGLASKKCQKPKTLLQQAKNIFDAAAYAFKKNDMYFDEPDKIADLCGVRFYSEMAESKPLRLKFYNIIANCRTPVANDEHLELDNFKEMRKLLTS